MGFACANRIILSHQVVALITLEGYALSNLVVLLLWIVGAIVA